MNKKFVCRDGATVQLDGVSGSYTFDGKNIQLDSAVVIAMANGTMDADGAVFFQRQLEKIKAKSYDVRYPELKARSLFPVSNEGGDGIQNITYRTYDAVGSAQIINAYANDLPRADVTGKEVSIPVRSVGTSYGYNIDEIRASQLTGAGLDQRRANAASKSNEITVNQVAFYGDQASGLPGFFSNPNIPVGNAPDYGNGTEFVNKTPEEILRDINGIFSDVFESTNMVETANTLLLPPQQWSHIMTTPRSAGTETTIAQYIVNNSPFLSSIESIIPLNECSAAINPKLTTDAMVAYDRNPDKLELEIPVELQWLPMQQKNLEFVIPGRSRLAGLNVYYPMSISIVTGI